MNPTARPAFSVRKAHAAQLRMSKKIIQEDRLPRKLQFIAGVDVAYLQDLSIGAVVVLDYDSLELVEKQSSACKTRFPYVPTLLSFREISPATASIKKLHTSPDVLLVDGQGLAHPFGCGFASHLGLVLGKPTIGVAKSRLFGKVQTAAQDSVAFLEHGREVVGAEVTTKQDAKSVYVSVGHMISLGTAVKIVKSCTRNNRLPVPLLKAHETATAEKRKLLIWSARNE
jgi:deoxyribonuclease V